MIVALALLTPSLGLVPNAANARSAKQNVAPLKSATLERVAPTQPIFSDARRGADVQTRARNIGSGTRRRRGVDAARPQPSTGRESPPRKADRAPSRASIGGERTLPEDAVAAPPRRRRGP